MKFPIILTGLISVSAVIFGQNIDQIIEQVYQTNKKQEEIYQSLYPYSYHQDIIFQKLDDDGEIEEQSRRAFNVRAISAYEHNRTLVKALNYEDGVWHDVTAEERDKQKEGEGKKFSLKEMVGPENRDKYLFTMSGSEEVNGTPVYHITVDVREPDEEKFKGDLWVHKEAFIVVKAVLKPSDLPTAVDTMTMEFVLDNNSGYWLPAHVKLDAEISFLFFFSGRIKSDITFSDYEFSSP